MNKKILLSIVITIGLLFIPSCASVPVTGRKQMLLVSDSEVLTLSLQQYGDFMKSAPKSKDTRNSQLVTKVGQKIANAVETYLRQNGMEAEAKKFAWEFNLVASADVNAFCMPGGKIVVYEGILPVTQDETGLAVVLGHEVAHAVAKHSNERMSQQMAAQYGNAALGAALGGQSQGMQQIASAAFGLGAQYGMLLPHSRKQELEADHLGLVFMAMAGYNPAKASDFWTRMSKLSGGSKSEFTSTHPSDDTRITKINEYLPEALKYYKQGGSNNTSTSKPGSKTSNDWSF